MAIYGIKKDGTDAPICQAAMETDIVDRLVDTAGEGEGETNRVALTHRHSAQFSRSVVSDSLQPHEPQHARLPCPSPTPGAHPNSCASSQ